MSSHTLNNVLACVLCTLPLHRQICHHMHRMAFKWVGKVQSTIEGISDGIHICPRWKIETIILLRGGLLRLNLLISPFLSFGILQSL